MTDQATAYPETITRMEDAMGRLVPITLIKPIDLARDALVREIAAKARCESTCLAAFKLGVFDDIQAFVEMSAEEYGVTLGGKKGNVTLTSFDGKYKIQRAMSATLVFDERLQAAKELIDQCIHEWSQGSRPEIMALVNDAFQVDVEGNINTGRVLGLKRLKIDDPKWLQAMQAIQDSTQTASSKAYFRVYERDDKTGEYKAIPLDVAAA